MPRAGTNRNHYRLAVGVVCNHGHGTSRPTAPDKVAHGNGCTNGITACGGQAGCSDANEKISRREFCH